MLFSAMQDTSPSPVTGRYNVSEKGERLAIRWDAWLGFARWGDTCFRATSGEFKRELGWRPVRLALEQNGEVVGLGQFLVYDTPLVPGALMYCAKGPWLPWDDEEAVRAFFRGRGSRSPRD